MKKTDSPKLIMITGCNKGIGFSVVRSLAQNHPEYNLLMAVRSLESGKTALKSLEKSFPGLGKRTTLRQLDVSSSASIDAFVSWVKTSGTRIDCLVDNAGVGITTSDITYDLAKSTFATNFYGTIELNEKLMPLLPDGAKVIVVTSIIGTYGMIGGLTIKDRLENPALTVPDIKKIADEFCAEVKAGKASFVFGGISPVYAFSKLLLNLYVRALVKEEVVAKRGMQVYACHPGWVKTDMGGPKAPMSLEEGAVCPCYLINLPWKVDATLQGKFFSDSKVAPL